MHKFWREDLNLHSQSSKDVPWVILLRTDSQDLSVKGILCKIIWVSLFKILTDRTSNRITESQFVDPQFRLNLRPVIPNKNGFGTPKVFVRSTSIGSNAQNISRTPLASYRQIYGANYNDFQCMYSSASPLQSFRMNGHENQYQNYFSPDHQSYLQINTERQMYSTNHQSEELNILTYRSEPYVQGNPPGLKNSEANQIANYSEITTLSGSQLSSNPIFEPEDISFVSQNANLSNEFAFADSNPPETCLKDEPIESNIDSNDHTFPKIDSFADDFSEINFSTQKNNTSLERIYEDYPSENHFHPNHTDDSIAVSKEYDISQVISHNSDEESLLSSSDTQGCMEICITPPLSTDITASNNFYLPEDSKEEGQVDSVLRTESLSERLAGQMTPENCQLDSHSEPKANQKRKFRLSTLCPRFVNCLFPWIRSDEYFEDHDKRVFYIPSSAEETQTLINS
ncbi:hypothetical protein OIY81_2894 [Cryptosporidium canis]|nr:hypothetical protein OIY81_2894 [Cryptosporidium canis]